MKNISQLRLRRSSTAVETDWGICPPEAQEILKGLEEVGGECNILWSKKNGLHLSLLLPPLPALSGFVWDTLLYYDNEAYLHSSDRRLYREDEAHTTL